MNITHYTSYFHDGTLLQIDHRDSCIVFTLESAEIDPMEIGNISILSQSNTLFGKLHLNEVKSVKADPQPCTGVLRKTHDSGEILDLEVHPGKIFLLIAWADYPPKPETNDVSSIDVEAEAIYWENMPSAKGYKFRGPVRGPSENC